MAEERVQRKLVAILAADVVGYSRMMSSDEPGTLSRLKTLRADIFDPTTSRFGGRIFKTTGDGVLAEFASAVDAVQCAVEIQRSLDQKNADAPEGQQMALRIGISLGDVVVDGDDLYGNGVNVAARMEGLAETGGICVSGNVQEHIRNTLDVALEDLGEQSVKNIDQPVKCFRVHLERGHTAGKPLPLPEKPSIAVLPFSNMSGDPEQEYFADGIAEDIITALSRFSWFFVIARNSSFSYKGTSPDIRQVAKELGVQYVLEGSVRKAANRVRITAQLIDALTARHVWADRFDRQLDDIFTVQDEITESITGAVAPAFASAELRRADQKAPENLDAWDYTMRGNWHLWRCTREDVAKAKKFFETAIERDKRSAFAYTGLAIACVQENIQGWTENPKNDRQKASEAAKQAITLDDRDAWAHAVHGYTAHISGDDPAALTAVRKAIELNPNLHFAEGVLGLIQAHHGEYDEAINHADKAARLSPRDPSNIIWVVARAVASFATERYEEHLQWSRKLAELNPGWPSTWRHLAVALANLDRLDEAKQVVEKLQSVAPGDSITSVSAGMSFFQPAQLKHFLDGLRKAGIPEK